MAAYVWKRAAGGMLVLLGVSTAVFFMLRMIGDPTALLVAPDATREQVEEVRRLLGLDRPLYLQFVQFFADLLKADFGRSFRYNEPAVRLVLERVPATLILTTFALALALVVSMPLGMTAAARHGTIWDRLISGGCFIGQAVPVFWVGIMFIIVFAVRLGWLPTSGAETWRHVILPGVTLSLYPLSQFTRLLRSEILEVLRQEYIRTAYAKGVPSRRVFYNHAFRNAAVAMVTLVGLTTGVLLGGAILTETVFAWPGIGRLLVQAIETRDYPMVQATVFMVALVFVVVNTLIDLTYVWLDPRIRHL